MIINTMSAAKVSIQTSIPRSNIVIDRWDVKSSNQHDTQIRFMTSIKNHSAKSVSYMRRASYKIFTSLFNKWYLNQFYQIPKNRIVVLPFEETVEIFDTDRREAFNVTAIEANYCSGSAMFLFQGSFGNVLYTGYFRTSSTSQMYDCPALKKLIDEENLDTAYIDNSYAAEHCNFPSRSEVIQNIINFIRNSKTCEILISSNQLGKEEVLLYIASNLDEKIAVSNQKYEIFQKLSVNEFFTRNVKETRIRAIDHLLSERECKKIFFENKSCIIILLTALYEFEQKHVLPKSNLLRLHIVPYSGHCNHSELKQFVATIRPRTIKPIVQAKSDRPCSVIPASIYALCSQKGAAADSDESSFSSTESSVDCFKTLPVVLVPRLECPLTLLSAAGRTNGDDQDDDLPGQRKPPLLSSPTEKTLTLVDLVCDKAPNSGVENGGARSPPLPTRYSDERVLFEEASADLFEQVDSLEDDEYSTQSGGVRVENAVVGRPGQRNALPREDGAANDRTSAVDDENIGASELAVDEYVTEVEVLDVADAEQPTGDWRPEADAIIGAPLTEYVVDESGQARLEGACDRNELVYEWLLDEEELLYAELGIGATDVCASGAPAGERVAGDPSENASASTSNDDVLIENCTRTLTGAPNPVAWPAAEDSVFVSATRHFDESIPKTAPQSAAKSRASTATFHVADDSSSTWSTSSSDGEPEELVSVALSRTATTSSDAIAGANADTPATPVETEDILASPSSRNDLASIAMHDYSSTNRLDRVNDHRRSIAVEDDRTVDPAVGSAPKACELAGSADHCAANGAQIAGANDRRYNSDCDSDCDSDDCFIVAEYSLTAVGDDQPASERNGRATKRSGPEPRGRNIKRKRLGSGTKSDRFTNAILLHCFKVYDCVKFCPPACQWSYLNNMKIFSHSAYKRS